MTNGFDLIKHYFHAEKEISYREIQKEILAEELEKIGFDELCLEIAIIFVESNKPEVFLTAIRIAHKVPWYILKQDLNMGKDEKSLKKIKRRLDKLEGIGIIETKRVAGKKNQYRIKKEVWDILHDKSFFGENNEFTRSMARWRLGLPAENKNEH